MQTLVETAETFGISREELLAHSALRGLDLASPPAISPVVIDQLVSRAAQLSGDEHFGLRWCEVCNLSALGPLLYAFANVRSYRAGAAQFAENLPWLGVPFQVSLVSADEHVAVRMEGEVNNPSAHRVYVEVVFYSLTRLLSYCAGIHGVPRYAAFRYAAPADLSRYQKAFGCELRFDAQVCELAVDNAVADRTNIHFDTVFSSLLTTLADVPGASSISSRQRWSERVLKVFAGAPSAHMSSMDEVATVLSISERTLRRRLSEEGVRFPALAEQAMVKHALALLRDRTLPVKEIAARLGYSDASAFTRALRRCTGYAPRAFRAQNGPASAPLSLAQ